MKTSTAKLLALALLLGAAGLGQAMAQSSVYIRVGNQPPPSYYRYEKPWAKPYNSAVWVPGHYDWRKGRYVWVPGYYSYPPRGGKHWVQPGYRRAPDGYYYRPGYWAR